MAGRLNSEHRVAVVDVLGRGKTCSNEEMKWFLTQEVAGEAGFEDLTALTQVKLPPRAKLELARNYWDEMGRGNAKGMHGPLLATLAEPEAEG
jgi:hypothetical protein